MDGELIDLAAPPGRLAVPEVAVVLDRAVLGERLRGRLTESIETCLREGGGGVEADLVGQRPLTFRETLRCPDCAVDLELPQPLPFSFSRSTISWEPAP